MEDIHLKTLAYFVSFTLISIYWLSLFRTLRVMAKRAYTRSYGTRTELKAYVRIFEAEITNKLFFKGLEYLENKNLKLIFLLYSIFYIIFSYYLHNASAFWASIVLVTINIFSYLEAKHDIKNFDLA